MKPIILLVLLLIFVYGALFGEDIPSRDTSSTGSETVENESQKDSGKSLKYDDYDVLYSGIEGRATVYLVFDYDNNTGIRIKKNPKRDGGKTNLTYFTFEGDFQNGLYMHFCDGDPYYGKEWRYNGEKGISVYSDGKYDSHYLMHIGRLSELDGLNISSIGGCNY